MPDTERYPFGKEEKIFEQTGWLKAEIETLKKSQITREDLLEFEKTMVKSFQSALNDWWEHKPRELDDRTDRRIEAAEERKRKIQEEVAKAEAEREKNVLKFRLRLALIATVLSIIGLVISNYSEIQNVLDPRERHKINVAADHIGSLGE